MVSGSAGYEDVISLAYLTCRWGKVINKGWKLRGKILRRLNCFDSVSLSKIKVLTCRCLRNNLSSTTKVTGSALWK